MVILIILVILLIFGRFGHLVLWSFWSLVISWAKAPALYVTMSQVVVVGVEVHFLDLAFRAQIELRNVKVKVTLR